MGTYGFYEYIIDSKKYTAYTQFDADTMWSILSRQIYVLLKHYGSVELLKNAFKQIKIIDNTTQPTQTEINELIIYYDPQVGTQRKNDWYCLLRKTQMNLILTLNSGYMLFEKYIPDVFLFTIDFDNNKLSFQYSGEKKEECNIEDVFTNITNPPTITYDEYIAEFKTQSMMHIKNHELISNINLNLKQLLNYVNHNCKFDVKNMLSNMRILEYYYSYSKLTSLLYPNNQNNN